jgi:hypothetical protein
VRLNKGVNQHPAPVENCMLRRARPDPLIRLSLAVLVLLLAAAPVCACSDRVSLWDWDYCWLSVPRWLLLAGAGAAWWFLCFHRLFPALLSPTRKDAPWPSVAFRRCLALFWLLVWLTFVTLFAWLSDELSGGLRSAPWFSRNWKWLVALLVGLAGAVAIWAPKRQATTANKG